MRLFLLGKWTRMGCKQNTQEERHTNANLNDNPWGGFEHATTKHESAPKRKEEEHERVKEWKYNPEELTYHQWRGSWSTGFLALSEDLRKNVHRGGERKLSVGTIVLSDISLWTDGKKRRKNGF